VVSLLLSLQQQGFQTKLPGAVVSFNLRNHEHPDLLLNYCQRAWGLYLPDMYSAQKVGHVIFSFTFVTSLKTCYEA